MKIIFIFYLYCVIIISKILSIILPIFKTKQKGNVLFLENLPIENAGYQYRAAKWCEQLKQFEIKCEIVTLYENKDVFEKQFNDNLIKFFISSINKRFSQVIYARKFQTVIVRRELLLFNDYGNLFMDKFLLKIHHNVILDFDDDIAAAKNQPKKITSKYGKIMLEDGNKFNNSLRLYKRFIVGSNYLKQKVLAENPTLTHDDILIIPTCVDYNKYPTKIYDTEKMQQQLIFGWIGGNRNLHYLDILIEPLNKIVQKQNIKLIVVAGKDYINNNAKFEIENQKWNLETEKEQIKQFDIGLMPLNNNAISKGKCGFKLIQYMGVGIASIATNITINGEIIKDEVNSFLVNEDNSNWEDMLLTVVSLQKDFSKIGVKARKTIEKNYTFEVNKEKYIKFVIK